MLSKFKLQTLKQKLWAIVAASFVARVIMFFVLPNTPSSLAPDEGTYASLTKWIGDSSPANLFPIYGENLYHSSRTIILPASLLYRAGFEELGAVRFVAAIYGFCSLLLVVFMILKLFSQSVPSGSYEAHNENLIAILVLVFAFLPSHFVWSNLGLRESATEFSLITALIAFFVIFHHQKKITFLSLLLLAGSISLTFSARPQVGWVLGVSLIVYLVFNLRQTNTYFVLPIILCAVVLGSTFSTGGTPGDSLRTVLNAGETIEYMQEVNQLNAASVIETQSCPIESSALGSSPLTKFSTYFCIAWRAPYMVTTFLFRPVLGVDVTSRSSLFAAFENVAWSALIVILFWLLIRRRTISFLAPLLPAIIFLFLYVLGASAYEGNMGTGFRHKSLILWAVLLVIFALAWRKPSELLETVRNNSQENAV
jgi:hypothetical protein